MNGTVKFFNNKKGWGFIADEEGKEYFVHYSEIRKEGYKSLKKDQPVTFDLGSNEKGQIAVNVNPV